MNRWREHPNSYIDEFGHFWDANRPGYRVLTHEICAVLTLQKRAKERVLTHSELTKLTMDIFFYIYFEIYNSVLILKFRPLKLEFPHGIYTKTDLRSRKRLSRWKTSSFLEVSELTDLADSWVCWPLHFPPSVPTCQSLGNGDLYCQWCAHRLGAFNYLAGMILSGELGSWTIKKHPLTRKKHWTTVSYNILHMYEFIVMTSRLCRLNSEHWQLRESWFHSATHGARSAPPSRDPGSLGSEPFVCAPLFRPPSRWWCTSSRLRDHPPGGEAGGTTIPGVDEPVGPLAQIRKPSGLMCRGQIRIQG